MKRNGIYQLSRYFFGIAIIFSLAACTSQNKTKAETDSEPVYKNNLVAQRADPWVYKDADETYYFVATAPEYDRIEIRKSKTINGITDAEAVVVWRKHETGVMGHHIWAPEMHKIDGKWYIYFAAGEAENIWNIRIWVLSNEAADPTTGEWVEEGRVMTERESFSLDATTFEHKGKRYLIWAQNVRRGENTSLVLSEMESPTKLTGPEVIITDPDQAWERIGYKVNEGPAVIKRNGKLFVSYSASATDHNYAMGLLWIDENADLLDTASWHKLQEPVFYTNDSIKRYGPGHSCFTIAEDGKTDVLIYHARDYKELQGSPLSDPNRHTRARVLHWDENGFPDFGQNIAD